jgi:hypothetical protein
VKPSDCSAALRLMCRREFLLASNLGMLTASSGRRASAGDVLSPAEPQLKLSAQAVPAPCSNSPFGGPFYAAEPLTRPRTTKALFDKDKLWDNGLEIIVRFLNGKGDPWLERVQHKVREIASFWCNYANLKFRFVDAGPCHMSVNFLPFTDERGDQFGAPLFNCYVGTDTKRFLGATQSMNLLFDPAQERVWGAAFLESEFNRHILHEFGHAIGLIHEHQRFDGVEWMRPELYSYARKHWGWDDKTVNREIIQIDPATHLTGTVFDDLSIMMYEFARGLAFYKADGRPFSSPCNTALTALDKVAANSVYPKKGVAQPGMKFVEVGKSAAAGEIHVAGQVARYYFQADGDTKVRIVIGGPTPTLTALLLSSDENDADRGGFANILRAVESTDGKPEASMTAMLPQKKTDPRNYYLEVRHRSPLSERGNGPFTIKVEQL